MNYGTFNLFTADPFQTSDTLDYTNYGSMTGAVGWRFDYGPPAVGQRQMADSFFNGAGGSITANDISQGIFIIGVPAQASVLPSYLWVHATNIVNQGLLSVGRMAG